MPIEFNNVSAPQYLDYYYNDYNEYQLKQAASRYWKLPLKPTFFSAFLIFWNYKSLII